MKRTEGERVRLKHSIARLRAVLDSTETGLSMGGPVGLEAAQAVILTSTEIAMQIAKLDAFELAEQDQHERDVAESEA